MHIRQATLEDAGHFVRVFEIASHGLAQYFWHKTADPDQDTHTVALKSMQDKLAIAAPNTALIAQMGGQVVGGIISYDIGSTPQTVPPECDPVIVPLIQLENQALNTHYVNALAVFPRAQGRGIGTALLGEVEKNAGSGGLSLIVEDQNTQARNLYERENYRACATAAIVKGGWQTSAKSYILMKRELSVPR